MKKVYVICKRSPQDGLYGEPHIITAGDIKEAQGYVALKLQPELVRIYGPTKFKKFLFRIDTVDSNTMDVYYNEFFPKLDKDIIVSDIYRIFIKEI